MPPEDNILLNVRGLSKHFGGIKAVEEVTFAIEKRSIISMIGPNGAGKSTFINVVSGIYAPMQGRYISRRRHHGGSCPQDRRKGDYPDVPT